MTNFRASTRIQIYNISHFNASTKFQKLKHFQFQDIEKEVIKKNMIGNFRVSTRRWKRCAEYSAVTPSRTENCVSASREITWNTFCQSTRSSMISEYCCCYLFMYMFLLFLRKCFMFGLEVSRCIYISLSFCPDMSVYPSPRIQRNMLSTAQQTCPPWLTNSLMWLRKGGLASVVFPTLFSSGLEDKSAACCDNVT